MLTPAQIALIDEFGKLYGEKQSWTPRERRMELLTETIRSWYQDLPAGKQLLQWERTAKPGRREACQEILDLHTGSL